MKRSGNGKIVFPDKQSSLWGKARTSAIYWYECCWLGGRRNDTLMAPNGVSWSTKVQCLHPRTNPCPTKSNFTMTVGLPVFHSAWFALFLSCSERQCFFFFVGKLMKLGAPAEEVATFFAKMLDHEYTTKDVFRKNFFKDWRKVRCPNLLSPEHCPGLGWYSLAFTVGNDIRGEEQDHWLEQVQLCGDEWVF